MAPLFQGINQEKGITHGADPKFIYKAGPLSNRKIHMSILRTDETTSVISFSPSPSRKKGERGRQETRASRFVLLKMLFSKKNS